MSNENNSVEKFDPAQLMQGVKDRIKSTFVSLIPDEQWEQMVKTEVDNFFKGKELGYQGNRVYASDFQVLVRNMVNQEAKDRLVAYMSGTDFQEIWQANGQPIASEAVRKLVVENSGAILTNFYSGIVSSMMHTFAANIRNGQF